MAYKPPFKIEFEPVPKEIPAVPPEAKITDREEYNKKKINRLKAIDIVTLILLLFVVLLTDEAKT